MRSIAAFVIGFSLFLLCLAVMTITFDFMEYASAFLQRTFDLSAMDANLILVVLTGGASTGIGATLLFNYWEKENESEDE